MAAINGPLKRLAAWSLLYCLLTGLAGSAIAQDRSAASGEMSNADERPNILWLVSEDNGPFLGCYGDGFATTPNLDKLAAEGVLYENAFSSAPVCAPSRSTLITGVYPTSMGTQHMRSQYPLPEIIRFFPEYLRKAGYYTTNNSKTDYNTSAAEELIKTAWDESSKTATYKNRKPGQPFFAVFNTAISHESAIHKPAARLKHDPEQVPIPPYHPHTPEMKHDWAQYYDKVSEMDQWVGEQLKALEEAGLAENTIVFYYSDHGGVLGRSKRFLYESGLHVPLIIRFPEKYAHLAPGKAGTRSRRIVTFADFAPTVLRLAGLVVPDYMQGTPFLAGQKTEAPPGAPRQYAFGFRGRMDERFDMSRTVRDKQYRYIRNYMPHKIYGQYLEYLWRAPSMRSWEAAYRTGELNQVQSAFWKPKPAEELYDVNADPHNVRNLADEPAYSEVLQRLRQANRQWLLQSRDVGFIPEPILADIARETPLYDYARSGQYPLDKIMEMAEAASSGDPAQLEMLRQGLRDENRVVRYWAATGYTVLGKKALSEKALAGNAMPETALVELLKDPEVCVQIAAAEALYYLGEKQPAVKTLTQALGDENRMARVQALNVLQNIGAPDALPALDAVKALIPDDPKDNSYDVRAAKGFVAAMNGNR